MCGEKQSLKRVFFNGSGKECRLQVQKLNELKGSNDQNYFPENASSGVSQSSGIPSIDALEAPQTASQANWSDLDDEYCDEDFNGLSTEHTVVQELSKKEVDKTANHKHRIQLCERNDIPSLSTWGVNFSNSSNEFEVPIKSPKTYSNYSKQ